MVPLKNFYHKSSLMLKNMKSSGRDKAKRLGIKHDYSHVKISKEQLAIKLKNTNYKFICCFCKTPIKIWSAAGYSSISCDRYNSNNPYHVDNIRFSHNRCNCQDGSWRKSGSKTVEDFRRSLTEVGVEWCESDSDEAKEIFKKNKEYFQSNTSEQTKLEEEEKENMKNKQDNRETVVIGGIQLELEPHHIEWLLSTLANSITKSSSKNLTSKSDGCSSKKRGFSNKIYDWIKTLNFDTKITAKLIREKFENELKDYYEEYPSNFLTASQTTKKGRSLIFRDSSGVYRRRREKDCSTKVSIVDQSEKSLVKS